MILLICWIVLTILVGNAGKSRKVGGPTAFFCALFFSPLIGLLVVLTSDKLHETGPQAVAPASVADELIKLKGLHESGVLTATEYEAQKARVLGIG